MIKLYLFLIFSCSIFLSGIIIGYYELFPVDSIKELKYLLQNNFEKEQKLTEEGNQPSNSRVALIQKLLNSKSNSFQMFQQFISFILKNR